jgi:hypothetical protein
MVAAIHAYDAEAWRFGRPLHDMNFWEVRSQGMQPHWPTHGQRWISIVEVDEQFMAQWRRDHLKDMEFERTFWDQKKAERRAAKAEKRHRKATIKEEYAKGHSTPTLPSGSTLSQLPLQMTPITIRIALGISVCMSSNFSVYLVYLSMLIIVSS